MSELSHPLKTKTFKVIIRIIGIARDVDDQFKRFKYNLRGENTDRYNALSMRFTAILKLLKGRQIVDQRAPTCGYKP